MGEALTTEMSQTTVPQRCGGGGRKSARRRGCRRPERVEIPRAIAPDDYVLGAKILHGKTKRINSIEQ